jgi:hypothetical protein
MSSSIFKHVTSLLGFYVMGSDMQKRMILSHDLSGRESKQKWSYLPSQNDMVNLLITFNLAKTNQDSPDVTS